MPSVQSSIRCNNFSGQRENDLNDTKMLPLACRTASSLTGTSFQFSRIATLNNVFAATRCASSGEQPNLLRFPAFPLKDTIDKFLKTAEPLLNAKELAETRKAAAEFCNKEGACLQGLLEKVAQKEENWLATRWQRIAYFQFRDPVTVFSSPGQTFPIMKFKTQDELLNYTSKVIYAMLKYKQQIDCGAIPIAKIGKFELDNSQFKKVFGTCRIPKLHEDTIKYHPDSKHVVVFHKYHIYKLPVYSKDGKILCPSIIAKQLKKITESHRQKGTPFGLLSTDNRDNWAKSYKELSQSKENEIPLREIERSLFTVALDENVICKKGEELNVQAAQIIHGGGSKNSGNRWMDKTIQLCVNPNGGSGFTYEHSPAEGQPIAMIIDYVLDNFKSEKFFNDGASSNYEPSCELKMKSSASIEKYICMAQQNVDKLADNLHFNILVYKGYGKSFLKKQKLSPDSFIQMAVQYAFYKLHGVPAPTYETAHLRIYVGGRTETIRSCSNESMAFVKAMCNGDKNAADLLRSAVTNHRKYTTEALMGRGVDRHLFGLKQMAIENKLPIPSFYKSPGIVKSAHFRMSTSQVASKHNVFMGYGPITTDGYGCCYNPRDSSITLAITSWRHNKETCSDRFAKSLTEAFDTMKVTLESSKPKSKL